MKKIYLAKAKHQIARHNTMRDINKRIVLNYVRSRSPISRAEIARETSLQRSTVSAIIDDLILDELVDELGAGDSTGGRKPTLLQLKTGSPAAIGVDVTPRQTTIAVADLNGEIIEKDTFPTSPDIEYMNCQILGKVKRFTDLYRGPHLEVGMCVPGIADPSRNSIVYIPYFQWHNWDIAKQITEETGLPVIVDNDANAVALAELWFGAEEIRTISNFILVMIAEGIGTGIIIDGQVYRGENGAAGEFGHMFLAENAPVTCSCGRRDCWEAHASEKAIIHRYQANNGTTNKTMDLERLIGLAQNGERRAAEILKETAHAIGIGISNLIIGFSPQAIVVGGSIVRAWDLIKDEINILARRSIRHEVSDTMIVRSSLGDSPTIVGALSLVLVRKFASTS